MPPIFPSPSPPSPRTCSGVQPPRIRAVRDRFIHPQRQGFPRRRRGAAGCRVKPGMTEERVARSANDGVCRPLAKIIHAKKPPRIFPALPTRAYNLLIPPRIHCQAWQRGGVGAGLGARTQNPMHRACGKWSPSGDMGEAEGCRTDPSASCPWRRAGCACAAHKEAGTGGCVGIVRRDGNTPEGFYLPPGSPRRAVPVSNGDALPGNRRAHPRSRPLQRDPSRGQKPPNGAPEGVILQISDAAPPAPRPRLFDKPRADRRVGETVGTVQPGRPVSAVLTSSSARVPMVRAA